MNPDFYHLDKVRVAPDFISDLTFAEGRVEHRKGKIASRWERLENGDVRLCLTLPDGINEDMDIPNGYFCEKASLVAGEQILYFYKR